jgi:hypothetical protein
MSEQLSPVTATHSPVTDPAAKTEYAHGNRNRSYNASERLRGEAQDRMMANCVRDGEQAERDERPGVEAKGPPAPLRPEPFVAHQA